MRESGKGGKPFQDKLAPHSFAVNLCNHVLNSPKRTNKKNSAENKSAEFLYDFKKSFKRLLSRDVP